MRKIIFLLALSTVGLGFAGMASALIATTLLGILFFLGVSRTIGWDFYMQANGAWWNYAWGYVTEAPPLPVWPNPAMLAVFKVAEWDNYGLIVVDSAMITRSTGRRRSGTVRRAVEGGGATRLYRGLPAG